MAQPYEFITYAEAEQQTALIASAFKALGLKRCDKVCVLGANCPEWMLAMQVRFAGAAAAGSTNRLKPVYKLQGFACCSYASVAATSVLEDLLAAVLPALVQQYSTAICASGCRATVLRALHIGLPRRQLPFTCAHPALLLPCAACPAGLQPHELCLCAPVRNAWRECH